MPLVAPAAELGRLTVLSIVGEPLNAEIEVVFVFPSEQESIAANLAPADAYRRAQLTPIPQPEALRAAIERKPDGTYIVRVRSTEPINEPLVNMLIDLSWNGGDSVRQFSFLLDTIDRSGSRRAVAPAAVEPQRAPAAVPRQTPVAKPEGSAGVTRAPSLPATGGTYVVQRGDTLFSIARSTRHEGVSVAQMIVAIYRANGDVFADGNIDRLESGATLTIPGRTAAAAVTAAEIQQLTPDQGTDHRRGAAATPEADSDEVAARDRALAESRDRIGNLEQTVAGLRQLIEAREREIAAELERQRAAKAAQGSLDAGQPARKVSR